MLKTIFEICTPREDVLKTGALSEADFAADPAQVLKGDSRCLRVSFASFRSWLSAYPANR